MAFSKAEKQRMQEAILEKTSTTDKGLETICKAKGMPNASTVYGWRNKDKEFDKSYTRAKIMQAELIAEQVIELADKERKTTTTTTIKGKYETVETVVSDNHQRTRIQIDARKWLASKLYPKMYGNNTTSNIDVKSDGEKILQPVLINWRDESKEDEGD